MTRKVPEKILSKKSAFKIDMNLSLLKAAALLDQQNSLSKLSCYLLPSLSFQSIDSAVANRTNSATHTSIVVFTSLSS